MSTWERRRFGVGGHWISSFLDSADGWRLLERSGLTAKVAPSTADPQREQDLGVKSLGHLVW